jgi:hypothetical protein
MNPPPDATPAPTSQLIRWRRATGSPLLYVAAKLEASGPSPAGRRGAAELAGRRARTRRLSTRLMRTLASLGIPDRARRGPSR